VILRFITNNRETLVPILSKALYANTHLYRKAIEKEFTKDEKNSLGSPKSNDKIKTNPSSPIKSPQKVPVTGSPTVGSEAALALRGSSRSRSEDGEHKFVIDRSERKQPGPGQKWEELGHWNDSIVELTADILKLFTEMDPSLLARCNKQYEINSVKKAQAVVSRKQSWTILSNSSIAISISSSSSSLSSSSSSSSSSISSSSS